LLALPPPPGPPPGMGAIPSFAPPVPKRDHTVLIVSLVLGVCLLLCCGVGTTGFIGVVYGAYRTMQSDAVSTVDTYLSELRNGQYTEAYNRLCSRARVNQSITEFAQSEQQAGQITSYRVGTDIKVGQDGEWIVTAEIARTDGTQQVQNFPVVFDDSNTAQVCPG
jgi:hypothetical protein